MTHTPTTRPQARGDQPVVYRTGADVLRGVLAAFVLMVLVLALPVLLVLVSPPGFMTGLPSWDDTVGLLTRPDDGHLFLYALALVGWLGWASFAASVATELVSTARGLPAPHLPMLGLTQTAAAALIATAAVLITTTPTALMQPARANTGAASVDAPRVTRAPADTAPPAVSVPSTQSDNVDASARRLPTITVRRGDTLWGLATTHLRDGNRWREIFDLNARTPQADGGELTEARWILPGWTLRLPPDATGIPKLASEHPGPDQAPSPNTTPVYVVQEGDTLWDIAAARLGDGARYQDIYDRNVGQEQPNGQTLQDPDRIEPGWRLVLPEPKRAAATTQREHLPENKTAQPSTDTPSSETDTGSPRTPLAPPVPSLAPESRPDATSAVPGGRSTPHADQGWDSAATELSVLIAGITALAAAGTIGEIARRRRRQQRLRQPGERLPMPEPDSPDAKLEQTLRAAPQPITLAMLKQTLRALAVSCHRRQQALPRLGALMIGQHRIKLLLVEDPGEPVAPFTATADRAWEAPHGALADSTHELEDEDVPDPYPALVSLGVTDDAVILLNLEAAGTLTITGDPEQTAAVLRALVCELATSELSADCGLTLGAEFADLAQACDPTHVNIAHSASERATRISARGNGISTILDSASVPDVHEGRSRNVAEDAWTPEMVICTAPVGSPSPWSGVAAITCGDQSRPGWILQLTAGHTARLEPLAIDLQPSALDPETYRNLIDLLQRADEQPALSEHQDVVDQLLQQAGSNDEIGAVLAALPTAPGKAPELEHDKPRTHGAPRLMVLGPVTVNGGDKSLGATRRGRATELVAYLALHSGATMHQINEVMWPGQRVSKQNRNSFVSRVRHWLGHTADNQPYLAHVNDGGDYRLHGDVTCDWHDFLHLAREGLSSGEEGADDLEAALRLVRGRPFLGIDPDAYTWAEADTQQMISAIVDVAHTLANIRLRQDNARAAQAAAAQGLLAEPASEVLYRDAMRAALLRGDTPEVHRLRRQLLVSVASIDPDAGLEAETIELLASRRLAGSQPRSPRV